MATPEPRMRASYMQENIAALKLLDVDVAERVRASLPAELLARIANASRVDWLPLELDVALTNAVHAQVGIEGVRKWSRDAMLAGVEGPLLRPILRAIVSLFGLTPRAVLKHAAMPWNQIYQNCGTVRVDDKELQCVRVSVTDVPAAMIDGPYSEGTAGAFEAVLSIARVEGSVTLEVPTRSLLLFTVRWHR